MSSQKNSYLEMQREEATWASGRYALANGAKPEKENGFSILKAFERIMLSAGNEVGRLPVSLAQFALNEDMQER